MKVLISYQQSHLDQASMEHLCLKFASQLTQNHIDVAILTNHQQMFQGYETFPYPQAKKPFSFFFRKKHGKTVEEFFEQEGLFDKNYLDDCFQKIQQAICSYQPDVILDLNNPIVTIGARIAEIPVYSYVHMAMFRHRPFPSNTLKSLNSFLKELKLEQVLYVSDLYDYVDKTFTFTPSQLQPFDDSNLSFYRFRSMILSSNLQTKRQHIVVMLPEDEKLAKKQIAIIKESFIGSKMQVYIYGSFLEKHTESNLHFQKNTDQSILLQSLVMIHNGEQEMFEFCLMNAIPQIIINDGQYLHNWNANAAARCGIGCSIPLRNLSVATLYESYREILVDESFQKQAISLQQQCLQIGGFELVLTLFYR